MTEKEKKATLREKVWRGIKNSRTFTAFDIAQYSGASLYYVKEYIALLIKKGIVQRSARDGRKARYKLVNTELYEAPLLHNKVQKKSNKAKALEDMGWLLLGQLREKNIKEAFTTYKAMGALFENDI